MQQQKPVFKPIFDVQYFNGMYILAMNPQMARILMEEIKNQGNQLNCTVTIQIPFKLAEGMKDLCEHSSDWFLNSLGAEFHKLFEGYRERRLSAEDRNSRNADYDDLDEDPLDP